MKKRMKEEGRKSKGSLFSKVVVGVQDKKRRTGRKG
jgi:hypothetical protein